MTYFSVKEITSIAKGIATYIPPLNWYRKRTRKGGHTENPAYCYSVWLRHVCTMAKFGWRPDGAKVCEIGPGNSLGIGIVARFSGVEFYLGLDAVQYSPISDEQHPASMVRDISRLYLGKHPIPGPREFPEIRPELERYDFPSWLFERAEAYLAIEEIRQDLLHDLGCAVLPRRIIYVAPYESADLSNHTGSFDAVFSQAVLEHVGDPAGTYHLMFRLLKPKGWSWHVVDFRSHGLTSDWNGHWRYPQWLWRIVQGKREFMLNRFPLSQHIELAKQAGFNIEAVFRYREGEHPALARKSSVCSESFARPFRDMSRADASTIGAMLILQKP